MTCCSSQTRSIYCGDGQQCIKEVKTSTIWTVTCSDISINCRYIPLDVEFLPGHPITVSQKLL